MFISSVLITYIQNYIEKRMEKAHTYTQDSRDLAEPVCQLMDLGHH